MESLSSSFSKGLKEREKTLEYVISEALQIPQSQVEDDLEYRSISEWDSMGHVNLLISLEEEYGVTIDAHDRSKLLSVRDLRNFLMQAENKDSNTVEIVGNETKGYSEQKQTISRGLVDVILDSTEITYIDGENGLLQYRGYSIHELVNNSTFEETAYLLMFGSLPTSVQLKDFDQELKKARNLPEPIIDLLISMKEARPMDALRTAVSALGNFQENSLKHDSLNNKISLLSQIPIIVAFHNSIRFNRELVMPSEKISHAANLLYMLDGKIPSINVEKVLNKILILHADHGSNASAFTARVVTGTSADIYAALTAAIAAFSGKLHGGAIEEVLTMIKEIGSPDNATMYVKEKQRKNEPVMGFGHRVYKTIDPRAKILRETAQALSEEFNTTIYFEILESLVSAMKPYIKKGVNVNVDYYASLIYQLLGIPQDLFVPIFTIGRIPGWISQIEEQKSKNILIRPKLSYTGIKNQPYRPISDRNHIDSEGF